jgi:hypothetical protein
MHHQIDIISTKVTFSSRIKIKKNISALADNIYHAYLNGLNTRMLLHEYGSYQQCPNELHVRVEAVESLFMTEVRVFSLNDIFLH